MIEKLSEIETKAITSLEQVQDEEQLEQWRVSHLGRNAQLIRIFNDFGSLSKEERPAVGKMANQIKMRLETAWNQKLERLQDDALQQSLQTEELDVTLPGYPRSIGRLHPVTKTLRQIYRIFGEMGFQVFRSREVESDEFNFQLLNIPPHHPARDMQDTFYLTNAGELDDQTLLLRTQTSPGQIHAMRKYSSLAPENPPPIRIILPGMCYRFEQVSARYEIQFTQVEGLAVGTRITMSDLKGTLIDFARCMFGQNVQSRFRASHFPFTEPSAEMDIECFVCNGKGCSVCKDSGWLEILGCGMVHPVVLKNGGYDPEKYTGFAFGIGPERITMLQHRIEDIRYFWANDLRFLEQF